MSEDYKIGAGQAKMNQNIRLLAEYAKGLKAPEWKPLVVPKHPRQDDMDAFRNMPSRWS